jgi:hypothetical protein
MNDTNALTEQLNRLRGFVKTSGKSMNEVENIVKTTLKNATKEEKAFINPLFLKYKKARRENDVTSLLNLSKTIRKKAEKEAKKQQNNTK